MQDSNEFSDILIEAIEVFINHILYVRGIYPAQIFKKRRVYNTPIFVSIFPPLNTYLYQVLRTAWELNRNKELKQLDVVFYRNESNILETYNLQLSISELYQQKDDRYLLEFEEELRTALYSLTERAKPLDKLPKDTKFKVLLHTTQSGFVRLSHDPKYQDFPWLHESLRNGPETQKISILPLSTVGTVGLEVTAEVI